MRIYLVPTGWHLSLQVKFTRYIPPLMLALVDPDGLCLSKKIVEFVSYYQLLKNPPNRIHWMFDSGVYGVYVRVGKGKLKVTKESIESIIPEYLDFLANLKIKPDAIVEFDLQAVVGTDVVNEWRERFFLPFQKDTGIPVVFVRHPEDWKEFDKDVLSRPDVRYVGLSSLATTNPKQVGEVGRWVISTLQSGKKVHIFAFVSPKGLKLVPATSVDSSGWDMYRYGRFKVFDEVQGKFVVYSIGRESKPSKVAELFLKKQRWYNYYDIMSKDKVSRYERLQTLYEDLALEIQKMERWFTAYWRRKGVNTD